MSPLTMLFSLALLAGAPPQATSRATAPPTLTVVPGAALGRVTLGATLPDVRTMGAGPGFTERVLRLGAVSAAFTGPKHTAETAWVELAGPDAAPATVSYDGEPLDLHRDPIAIALSFGGCEPVEIATGGQSVQCQGGRVSVAWNQCPAGLAGPCRSLRIRVSRRQARDRTPATCSAYVWGDHLVRASGLTHLSLRPRLQPGDTLCVDRHAIAAGSSLDTVKPLLPSVCQVDRRRGGGWIRCRGLGVALGFEGPREALAVLAQDDAQHPLGGPSAFEIREVVAPAAPDAVVRWGVDGAPYVTAARPALTSAEVASIELAPAAGEPPRLSIAFTPEGTAAFAALTQRLVGKRLALLVDGCVYSAPILREAIAGGHALITLPRGTAPADAEALRAALTAGLTAAH